MQPSPLNRHIHTNNNLKLSPIYRRHKHRPSPLYRPFRHHHRNLLIASPVQIHLHRAISTHNHTYMTYNPPSLPSSPSAPTHPPLPRTATSPNVSRPALRLRISDNPLISSSSSRSAHPSYQPRQLPIHPLPCTTSHSHSSSTPTVGTAMRQFPPQQQTQAAQAQQAPPRPAPIQTQTPAVQSLRSAHSSLFGGSEPPSAVEESMGGAGGQQEVRPSADGVPLPTFLKLTLRETQAKFVDLEWQQRGRMNDGEWSRLQNADTAKRNRYVNVDPYEKNRIPLKVPEGHSDYINASEIHLKASKSGQLKNFIATQGPKYDSYSHIWRMIWDETNDVAVIVMLTQTHEMGKEKCFQYFPADLSEPDMAINESDEFGDGLTATLTLKSIHEDESTQSTVRELELRAADGKTKKIYHFLFAGWPDFAIPEGSDRQALVNLVQKSKQLAANGTKLAPSEDNPRIVHCSAGVGRTGTFIALDWLLDELADGSLDDLISADADADADPIAGVVDRLRQQRMMMVQGEQQFMFLYDVVRSAWIERWKSKQ